MNRVKMFLMLLLAAALLCAACAKDPVEDPTEGSELPSATEATEPVTEIQGVEDNQFEEDDIQIPTDPVSDGGEQETTGGVTNTGSGNSGNQGGTEKPTEAPKPTEPLPTDPETGETYVSYEAYNNMSPAEQVEYFNTFPSMEEFVKWYNEAKAKYDEEHGAIEIGGDGTIDLGDIINP